MERKISAPTLQDLVRSLSELYPDETATQLETSSAGDAARFLESLALPQGRAVFQRLSPDLAAGVLAKASDEWLKNVVPELEYGRAAALLARLPHEVRTRILRGLSPAVRDQLTALIEYPSDSAGALMDPLVTAFRPESTVDQVLARVREILPRRVHNVYIVDEEGKLAGTVALHELALADGSQRLKDLPKLSLWHIASTAEREEVVELFERHKMPSLPVVDYEGRLVGVIRHDAMFDAVSQEATADLQSMVGAGKEERALSKASFAVKKRLPWLQVNLGTAFLAAAVVGVFEETIARFTALAVLLPVVAGQSGNTGAQALAVTLRGLAVREITPRQWLRVMVKEASTGLINGLAVAIVTSVGVLIWSGSYGLSAVIGIAMISAMLIAGVAGALIPILLSKLGQDPAQSSSIVLTTVTDVFGFMSFLGLATAFSSIL